MLLTSFWTVNTITNNLQHQLSLANFAALFNAPVPEIIGRTVVLAALVTLTDAVLAFPFAYFMARIASRRTRNALFVAVLLPLWASCPGIRGRVWRAPVPVLWSRGGISFPGTPDRLARHHYGVSSPLVLHVRRYQPLARNDNYLATRRSASSSSTTT